jgi:hypothetical protein
MKKLSRFSLHMFLEEHFTSEDSAIKNVTNTYLAQDGHIHLINLLYPDRILENSSVAGWIMSKATDICVKETSWLTDTARKGKFYEEAKSLRLPSHSVKVELVSETGYTRVTSRRRNTCMSERVGIARM